MQRITILLLLTILLTACTRTAQAPTPGSETAPPVASAELLPAQPAAPQPAAEAPPAQQPADVSLPKLAIDQIHAVELRASPAVGAQVSLDPQEHPAQVAALLTALGEESVARPGTNQSAIQLTVVVRMRSDETLSLGLTEGGTVVAWWQGQQLAIASPSLAGALAALQPELAHAQKPDTTRLWAVDPTERKAPELLLDHAKALVAYGVSPDGQHVLLIQPLGEYKGDYTAVPYLWDRTTGKVTEGQKTMIRRAVWSGNGFYVDGVTHLDLALHETRNEQLAQALALKQGERAIIALSLTPDGKRFAALVGHPWNGGELDLVQGKPDGTDLRVIPKAMTGDAMQVGTMAALALSPDGQYFALTNHEGAAIGRSTDADPQQWKRLEARGFTIAWAPDSRHVAFQTGGVFDRTGQKTFTPRPGYQLVW